MRVDFDQKAFSLRLRERMKEFGYSWRDLEARSGVPPVTIHRAMHGTIRAIDCVFSLCSALGMDVNAFMKYNGEG